MSRVITTRWGTEPEYRNNSSVSTSWGAILQDELRFDAHRLVLGLDTRNQDTDTRSFKADGTSAVPYQPNVSTRGLGLFAQGHISLLADALNLSAGLRADFMNLSLKDNADLRSKATTESFSTLSPNLGLKYELAKGLMAHASIGSAFSAPSAYEKAGEYQTAYGVTRGNAALRPETSLTYESGDSAIRIVIWGFSWMRLTLIRSIVRRSSRKVLGPWMLLMRRDIRF